MIGQGRTLVLILGVLSSEDRRIWMQEETKEGDVTRSTDYIHIRLPGPAVAIIVCQ